jgi:hypothetical protein
MSVQILPYSPFEFNSLTGPEEAFADLTTGGGEQVIFDRFKAIFEKHNLCDQYVAIYLLIGRLTAYCSFGLCLLHRHYDINENQRFVELYNVATPWTLDDVTHAEGMIIPRCWKFTRYGTALVPYEYEFAQAEKPKTFDPEEILRANPKFVDELMQALDKFNLRDVLGLRVWPGAGFKGFTEITTSRLTITFPPSYVSENSCEPLAITNACFSQSNTESINTAWFFNQEFLEAKCVCKCLEPHGHHDGKHEHRTVTMEGFVTFLLTDS